VRILLTGATGFLGTYVLPKLLEQGHEVVAIVRPNREKTTPSLCNSPQLRVFEADLNSDLQLDSFSDIDAVVTLAQEREFRKFPERASRIFNVNVSANIQIWEWASRSGVERVVHASSGGVYGPRGGHSFSEDNLPPVDSQNSYYLGTKLCSEIAFRSFTPHFKSAIMFRPFFIYGPGQDEDKFVQRMISYVQNRGVIDLAGPYGLRVNPIFVTDAARIFVDALSLDGQHVFNCAGNETVCLKDFCSIIGDLLDEQPVFRHSDRTPDDCVGDVELQNQFFGPPTVSLREGLQLAIEAVQ